MAKVSRVAGTPLLGARQLVAIAIVMGLAAVLALFTLNSQRAVGAVGVETPVATPTSTSNLVANDLAQRVAASLADEGYSYTDAACPNYGPSETSPVQTCTALENGKSVYIDVRFDGLPSTEDFTAKVLRSA